MTHAGVSHWDAGGRRGSEVWQCITALTEGLRDRRRECLWPSEISQDFHYMGSLHYIVLIGLNDAVHMLASGYSYF